MPDVEKIRYHNEEFEMSDLTKIIFQGVEYKVGGGGSNLTFESLEMHKPPTITEYSIGENLSFDGMELYAIYTDGEINYMKDVSDIATPSIAEGTAVTEDMSEISFTYTDGKTDTASYTIDVFTGYSWARSTDDKIVEAMTKAYNNEIDLSEYFNAGDVREVTLTDGRKVHFELIANNDKIKAVASDTHGATEGKFLVILQECFQGTSEANYYGKRMGSSSTITMNELRIPQKAEGEFENYTLYDLLPTTIKTIFRLFEGQLYTRNGNYTLGNIYGNVHFTYPTIYWFNSTVGYRPSGYYDSRWISVSALGSSVKQSPVPEFAFVDDNSKKASYIAIADGESSSATWAYTTAYVNQEENQAYVGRGLSMIFTNNVSKTVQIDEVGVTFVGMI